jgi:hypothetical protein
MDTRFYPTTIVWSSKEELFPGVWVYRDVFKDISVIDKLEAIGKQAEQDNDLRYSWIEGQVGYSKTDTKYRDCVDIKLGEIMFPSNNTQHLVNDLWTELRKIQAGPVLDYCNKYSMKMDYWEVMNCIKYGPGQHFKEHADHGFSYSATVSLVGYINDDYEGGELTFPKLNLKIKPKAGDLYIFPSTFLFSHIAEPVQSGLKYSVVTMLDYNDHAHNPEFMQMREKWVRDAQSKSL